MEKLGILSTVQGMNPARIVPTPVATRGRGVVDAPTVPDAAFLAVEIEV
jgi:hypothetical protein